ncbi:MAG: hypothetical protein U0984_19485, partial [Prosthecobacter sp.]|nr:hypothetical protein [Prosthecobacter sp.]
MRLFILLSLCLALSCSFSLAAETTFFAFDDHAIPMQDNLQLTLVEARKHPANPVLRTGPEGSPDHGHAVLYGSVLHIGGKFRMWYLAMSQQEIVKGQAPGWWRPMCYAESDDGVKWTKPELGLVDFNGNKKNNICLIESDPFSLSRVNDFLSVMYEPDAPAAERYKCAYIAHMPFEEVKGGRSVIGPNENRWGSFVCATSADGLSWKVVGDRPANAAGERFEVSGLYRFGNFYYATGQLLSPWTWLPDGRDVGRVMLTYRSPDFKQWSRTKGLGFARPGQTLSTPVAGQQTHMGAGLWNRGNVMVGLYGMWQDGPKDKPKGSSHLWGTHVDLGLIVSDDGLHFREPVTDFKVIPRGKEGEWDNVALLQGHAFANVGDQTYLWYSHWDTGGSLANMNIGLATLRRDGFGYLATKHKTGEGALVTDTVEVSNPKSLKVRVNVDGVSGAAPLKLELLNDKDQSLGEAANVTTAGTQIEVTWAKLPAVKRG